MDPVAALHDAIGAAILRTNLLGTPPLQLAGRYAIQSFLGRGASGVVVAAHDMRLDRPVALKLSLIAQHDSDLTEARALARLDHPNVVRVHDAEIVDVKYGESHFRLRVLAMQRVDAVTARSWVQERARSVKEILKVYRDAGQGLAAAHAAYILHRDFKPDNVLVKSDGVAQVLDFGFAVAAAPEGGQTAWVVGTDPYMAPEAKQGVASARADQFAFAMSLGESLTGELKRPGFWTPRGVPRRVWSALRKATRAKPEKRFASMEAMLKRLHPPGLLRRALTPAAAVGVLVSTFAAAWQAGFLNHDLPPQFAFGEAPVPPSAPAPPTRKPCLAYRTGGVRYLDLKSKTKGVHGCYEMHFRHEPGDVQLSILAPSTARPRPASPAGKTLGRTPVAAGVGRRTTDSKSK